MSSLSQHERIVTLLLPIPICNVRVQCQACVSAFCPLLAVLQINALAKAAVQQRFQSLQPAHAHCQSSSHTHTLTPHFVHESTVSHRLPGLQLGFLCLQLLEFRVCFLFTPSQSISMYAHQQELLQLHTSDLPPSVSQCTLEPIPPMLRQKSPQ